VHHCLQVVSGVSEFLFKRARDEVIRFNLFLDVITTPHTFRNSNSKIFDQSRCSIVTLTDDRIEQRDWSKTYVTFTVTVTESVCVCMCVCVIETSFNPDVTQYQLANR